MSDPVVPPVDQATPQPDNGVIRQIRAQLDEVTTALKGKDASNIALTAELESLKLEKLSEIDKLRAENGSFQEKLQVATSKAESAAVLEEAIKTIYDSRIATAPEDKRAMLETISAAGDWPSRLKALEVGMQLAGAATATKAGVTTSFKAPDAVGVNGKPQLTEAQLKAGYAFGGPTGA